MLCQKMVCAHVRHATRSSWLLTVEFVYDRDEDKRLTVLGPQIATAM
jgi:hypothetical protein